MARDSHVPEPDTAETRPVAGDLVPVVDVGVDPRLDTVLRGSVDEAGNEVLIGARVAGPVYGRRDLELV